MYKYVYIYIYIYIYSDICRTTDILVLLSHDYALVLCHYVCGYYLCANYKSC